MRIVTYPERRRQLRRQIVSVKTATVIAAAVYGCYLGSRDPEALADSLAAGITVGAIVYAVGFSLTQRVRQTTSAIEMLHRDREIIRYGVSVLRRAMFVTLLVLAYIGLSGRLSTDSFFTPLFAAASSASLAWLLCGISRTFLRHVHSIVGSHDEIPDLGGFSKTLRRLRAEAIEDLKQTANGWLTSSQLPFMSQTAGPTFIAKELAIRFGVLKAEACLHYTQLCDRPDQAEAADRVQSIIVCLDEMKQLRNLEYQMRSLLTNDPELRRTLIMQ